MYVEDTLDESVGSMRLVSHEALWWKHEREAIVWKQCEGDGLEALQGQ